MLPSVAFYVLQTCCAKQCSSSASSAAQDNMLLRWRAYYVNYRAMKLCIEEIEADPSASNAHFLMCPAWRNRRNHKPLFPNKPLPNRWMFAKDAQEQYVEGSHLLRKDRREASKKVSGAARLLIGSVNDQELNRINSGVYEKLAQQKSKINVWLRIEQHLTETRTPKSRKDLEHEVMGHDAMPDTEKPATPFRKCRGRIMIRRTEWNWNVQNLWNKTAKGIIESDRRWKIYDGMRIITRRPFERLPRSAPHSTRWVQWVKRNTWCLKAEPHWTARSI